MTVNSLLLRGDSWEVIFEGRSAILDDSRGLRYVALLIQQAASGDGPLHASELVALASGNKPVVELSAKEQVLDNTGENQFIKRLEEIGFERNTAVAGNDFDKVALLDEEVDRITEELERLRAPGTRGGRVTFNDGAEKARKSVGKAISETIAKMYSLPETESLARHLSSAIRKGQWLSYGGTIPWDVHFHIAPQKNSSLLRRK